MSDWIAFDAQSTIKSRLTDYLSRGKQVPDVFAAIGAMHPKIEQISRYIYESENIYNAEGIELDRFGEYVDLARAGMNDDDYRQAILSETQRQAFSGAPDELIEMAENQTGTRNIILTERKSAAVNLHIVDDALVSAKLTAYMNARAIAGVRCTVTFGRGQASFFFAGLKRFNYGLGVNNSSLLTMDGRKVIGLATRKPFAFNNLTGMAVTPTLLATGDKVIGVNGKALALHKYTPKAVVNEGIRLAGMY